MNPKEALENIRYEFRPYYDMLLGGTRKQRYEEELKVLEELVDRATPKKVINRRLAFWQEKDESPKIGDCPMCQKTHYEDDKYCLNCGQAIDWTTDDR